MSRKNTFKQAKTKRGKRFLANRAPKTNENTKTQMVLRAVKTSAIVQKVLQEFHWMRQQHSIRPGQGAKGKKEEKRPFEDISNVELLGSKCDASLFVYGSHNKKRKHNIILGRLFDYQLLDMIELGVKAETFKSSIEMKKGSYSQGSKPAIVFNGEPFDNDDDFKVVKSVFIDFLRGNELSILNLSAMERVVVITANSKKQIFFRQYKVIQKPSEEKTIPRIELEEIGPHIDFSFRRFEKGSEELQKASRKMPRPAKAAKNIRKNILGERTGKIHMHRQNLDNLNRLRIKKPNRKALKGPLTEAGKKTKELAKKRKRKEGSSGPNKRQKQVSIRLAVCLPKISVENEDKAKALRNEKPGDE